MEVLVNSYCCDIYLAIYGGRLSKYIREVAELSHFMSTKISFICAYLSKNSASVFRICVEDVKCYKQLFSPDGVSLYVARERPMVAYRPSNCLPAKDGLTSWNWRLLLRELYIGCVFPGSPGVATAIRCRPNCI